MTPEDDGPRYFVRLVGRPLLFVVWSLVVWGTLWGLAFLGRVAFEGPSPVLARLRAGGDAANPALALAAAAVWLLVGAAIAWTRRQRPR